jgi:hypothetical protein
VRSVATYSCNYWSFFICVSSLYSEVVSTTSSNEELPKKRFPPSRNSGIGRLDADSIGHVLWEVRCPAMLGVRASLLHRHVLFSAAVFCVLCFGYGTSEGTFWAR